MNRLLSNHSRINLQNVHMGLLQLRGNIEIKNAQISTPPKVRNVTNS
jgi:hypothetical protein